MGLEIATYISGMTASWPISSDPKSQGDDQIRLIKGVLQNTFPVADKAFYFPKAEPSIGPAITLDVTDQNNVLFITTTAGNVTITLPSGFDTTKAGWACDVMKVSADVNAVVVSPASGTILSRSGSTATIRVGALCEAATFTWTGSAWVCQKPGPVVGSTINFDGPTAPYGYLTLDGSVFNGTTFAELAAVLGTTTLRDKRGRVEAGVDGAGRLTGIIAAANGSVGGVASHALALTEIPAHAHANTATVNDPGHAHTQDNYDGGAIRGGATVGGIKVTTNTGSALTGITVTMNNASAGSGGAHTNCQPTIVTQKLIRAC